MISVSVCGSSNPTLRGYAGEFLKRRNHTLHQPIRNAALFSLKAILGNRHDEFLERSHRPKSKIKVSRTVVGCSRAKQLASVSILSRRRFSAKSAFVFKMTSSDVFLSLDAE